MKEMNKHIDKYLEKASWEVKENSNSPYNFGGLNKFILAKASKEYWLSEVYDQSIKQACKDNLMHIHDLGGLTLYCCGYSLKDLIRKGVRGVPNIPVSRPAKHFDSILNQLANMTTVFQNEIMGAVAFSSFDTLLAPFVKYDNLTYEEVVQALQNYIFSINSNSRAGAEPAFSNLTFDLFAPSDMAGEPVIIGGEEDFNLTYGECQEQMDMINKAFCEIMLQGDGQGNPFAYPIPTYNIMKGIDWDNPIYEGIWEMAGKYGYPYFANFLNSDMEPSDIRSMCCRMSLDLRELRKRNGGLFGSGDSTGSIGNVTINLPKIAKLSQGNKKSFYKLLKSVMNEASRSLELKRTWLEEHCINTGLLPAFDEYVGTLDNHFSTIGILGMNEMCLNLLDQSINTVEGKNFALEVMDFMRDQLVKYQLASENPYNLEATPAESTCHRMARLDVMEFDGAIAFQGDSEENAYYTNSCHLDVAEVTGLRHLFSHQNELQAKFTGGTVIHCYLQNSVSKDHAKNIIKSACQNYVVPYISLSPLISICPKCGKLENVYDVCPKCSGETNTYQRITGYIREIKNFNAGKAQEFDNRKQLSEDTI